MLLKSVVLPEFGFPANAIVIRFFIELFLASWFTPSKALLSEFGSPNSVSKKRENVR